MAGQEGTQALVLAHSTCPPGHRDYVHPLDMQDRHFRNVKKTKRTK